MTTLDPETLERLRRQVPLRLDRHGQLFFESDPVSHPRVRALFLEGLDLTPAGEPCLQVGEQWCYLQVEDCLLRVVGVRPDPADAPQLRLDDGREVPLVPATLWEEPDQGLRCTVPARASGRPLSVRFTNTALADLAPWLDDGDPVALRIGDYRAPIPAHPPAP